MEQIPLNKFLPPIRESQLRYLQEMLHRSLIKGEEVYPGRHHLGVGDMLTDALDSCLELEEILRREWYTGGTLSAQCHPFGPGYRVSASDQD